MEVLKFKLFCIEMYKIKHKISGKKVLNLFNEYKVFDFIEECYDVLHTLDDTIITDDIHQFIENRK